jgi:hypothetical protein
MVSMAVLSTANNFICPLFHWPCLSTAKITPSARRGGEGGGGDGGEREQRLALERREKC